MTTLEGTWTYGYDGSGQLTTALFVSLDTAKVSDQKYQYFYDAVGNRTKAILNGVNVVYTVNSLNQYTTINGVAQQFDADGNLKFDGVNTYEYDQLNRLIQVSGADGIRQYEYDAFGHMTAKTINGVRSELQIDPAGLGNVVSEYSDSGARVSSILNGLGVVGRTAGTSWEFFDTDGLGSIVGITGSLGSTTWSGIYSPFGRCDFLRWQIDHQALFNSVFSGQSAIRMKPAA